MQKGFVLKQPVDFDNAMFLQKNIEVWQQGRLLDYGGQIQMHTDNAVIINDGKYLKATCEFRVR